MISFFLNNQDLAVWIVNILLSIISLLGAFLLWYLISLVKKSGSLDGKIEKTNKSIFRIKRFNEKNISQILTTQTTIVSDLLKIQRTLGSSAMGNESRQAEINKILDSLRRTNDRVEETTRTIEKSLQLLKTHNTEIINLKKGLLLIRDKKGDG